jgi:hypothetical protein
MIEKKKKNKKDRKLIEKEVSKKINLLYYKLNQLLIIKN